MKRISNNWWVLVLRGVLAILFGGLAIAMPGVTLAALIFCFAVFTIVDGLVCIALSFMAGSGRWWVFLLIGIVGVIAGAGAYLYPGVTALILLYWISFWAIFSGVGQIIAAIRLREEINGEWLLILGGICSVAFGTVLIAFPGAGAIGFILYIGAYAIFWGVTLTWLGFRLHAVGKSLRASGGHA